MSLHLTAKKDEFQSGSACHETGTFLPVLAYCFSQLCFTKGINCELTGNLSRKCVEKELYLPLFSLIYAYL